MPISDLNAEVAWAPPSMWSRVWVVLFHGLLLASNLELRRLFFCFGVKIRVLSQQCLLPWLLSWLKSTILNVERIFPYYHPNTGGPYSPSAIDWKESYKTYRVAQREATYETTSNRHAENLAATCHYKRAAPLAGHNLALWQQKELKLHHLPWLH